MGKLNPKYAYVTKGKARPLQTLRAKRSLCRSATPFYILGTLRIASSRGAPCSSAVNESLLRPCGIREGEDIVRCIAAPYSHQQEKHATFRSLES